MNDRALRDVVSSLGGVANGFPREQALILRLPRRLWLYFVY